MNNCEELTSYSSYTKGLFPISNINDMGNIIEISLQFPKKFYDKLIKRMNKFPCENTLSINGITSKIQRIETSVNNNSTFQVVLCLTNIFFSNSSLKKVNQESTVSVGMLSTNSEKWLLKGEPVGVVNLIDSGVAPNHQFTELFTFQCTKSQYHLIQNLEYIGLDGTGFLIQKIMEEDGHYFFSIHAGKETREKTNFNCNRIDAGTKCTLTLPAKSQNSNWA